MPRVEKALDIPADHPSFAGHFPGRPILPGVVLLAEVTQALAASHLTDLREWTLGNAKFLDVVAPGTSLTLAHESPDADTVRFEIRSPRGVVASGTFTRRANREAA